MAISQVQHKSIEFANVSSGGLAFTSSVTAGSAIICAGSAFSQAFGSSGVFTDNKSQTYAVDVLNVVNGTDNIVAGSTANAASGSTTVTLHPGGTCDCTIAIVEVSGLATSSIKDVAATNTGNSGTQTTGTTGTPNNANEYCWAGVTHDGSTGTVTVNTPYTIVESQTSATHMPLATASQIISSATTQSATFNWQVANYAAFVVTYKASGGAAAVQPMLMTMGVGS